jgi:MFS family permease
VTEVLGTADASGEAGPSGERLITGHFLLVTAATFAYFTAMGMQLPAIPTYVEDELGGGGIAVGVAAGIFAISAAVVRPWAGRLGDRRGRRILMVGGAGIFGLSVLGYTLASSLTLLLGFRLLSGVGEAAMFVGAATAIQDMAPPDRRAEAASYYSVALYLGVAVGPTLGEVLVDGPGYDTVWLVSGGFALLAAALGLFTPVGELHPADPDAKLLHPAAIAPGFVLLLGMVPFIGFATFLKLYGQEIGVDGVGPIFGAYALAVLLIRLLGAKVPDRLGWKVSSTIALIGAISGATVLALWGSAAALWVAVVPFAIGSSLLFPALFATLVDRVPDRERTSAVGTFSIFFDLANGLGAPLLGLVVALANHRAAFAAAALIGACGFFAQRRAAGADPAHIEMHIAEPG